MSILIKGMEMPKYGYRQIFIDSNGTVTWFNNGADGPNTMYKAKAIPVPPHGDLIDRKTAYDSLLNGMVMTGYQSKALDCINEFYVPTIIPAEEGE